ncbi:DUF1538 domain-containing protein [Dechloromonas sp. H13]|uniref:DUF1538 domain-containing protein n=1 Tax=Dechloromonas sp. H13 TaxID=2570193 RepID=UPI0012917A3F|nr:DUF1538 domain-containing protein [Dechloromonas sp. H13]
MSEKKIRYGQYLGAIRRRHRQVSYNDVIAAERALPARRTPALRLIDIHRLVTPYVSVRFTEQMRAVIPLALMLIGFQALALRTTPAEAETIALGICAVMLGLMFFMEGVKQGLMPFAENIGFLMPARSSTATILLFGALLGTAATFAEPAISALQSAAGAISAERAGLLKALLGPWSESLVLAVAGGVGCAVTLGLLRLMFGWQMKTLILVIVPLCLGLTVYAANRPGLDQVIGLAWDCGGITTGPVTVPLVLAVGIGVAASAGRGDNPLSGFGIVTLASLLPVIFVLGAAIHYAGEGLPPLADATATPTDWYRESPVAEMLAALRAILPLILLLFVVQRFLLRTPIKHTDLFLYGVCVAVLGMMAFNLGLTTGLVELGNQAGNNVPWAFAPHRQTGAPPLYPRLLGLGMTLLFAFCIGYGATVAEPALNAMGMTVENLSDGAFKKRLLVHAVACGVGIGAALGVARILFDLPLVWLLIGAYGIALALTVLSREEFVNLAWDSAGVTTGPVTVPLLLALGIGLGKAVGAPEGFGILAMCSAGPIVSVLAAGLWIERRNRALHRGDAARRKP